MTLGELYAELEQLREQRRRLDLSSPESLAARAEVFAAEAPVWASLPTTSDFRDLPISARLLLIVASVAAEDRAAERADTWRKHGRRLAEQRDRTAEQDGSAEAVA
ncbi:hypothetical protein BJF78_32690 [Pseudonocardia sp. CNS-139]|nr:hypothetical protein BJF78_32690 [Pseudonocardia sp. CNS-139]